MRRFLARRVSRASGATHARARARGFTLPELMVSLVAGLIVTVAVMGLARTATNTFYEQVRSTSSQMALRLASQRLTNDLSRASFMSSGNIRWDPAIARVNASCTLTGSRYTGLDNLAGIRLYMAGSTQNPELTLETDNALRPEAIDITGNMTSNDQYIATAPSVGGCTMTLDLLPNDPAVLRIVTSIQPDGTTPPRADVEATALLRSIFLPVAGSRFPARVTDTVGKTHFVVIADAFVAGGKATLTFAPPSSGPACPILEPTSSNQCGGAPGALGFAPVQIAPIQTVRWSLRRVPNLRLDPPEDAAMKFDLVRQYVDATGALAGLPEVIVEYATDLKFAFSVDQTPGIPNMLSFDFEDEISNGAWAANTTNGVASSARNAATDPAPHRIRSVRFRISDRAARPDREFDLPGQPPGYPLRYCLDGPPSPTCVRYARLRTITSEVALINQARMNVIANTLPAY